LQQTRAAFDELLTDAHQVQADLQQTQAALQQTQTTLQQTQTELDQMRLQNQQLQSELERSHAKITAIETSKFWQLRTTWLQIKRRLGFLGKE
jgi:chromosome segregation ATPase